MSTAPQIAGYTLGEQLLDHPLAAVWRGRSVTGMEVVALVLSDAGAADAAVRERLAEASRAAALEPGRAESPLWAANLNATHPYAITQLAPGYSGAERLLDPLDGVIGNDQSAIAEVRARLDSSTYAAQPAPSTAPGATAFPSYAGQPAPATDSPPGPATDRGTDPAKPGPTEREITALKLRSRKRLLGVPVVAALVAFVVTYSVGAQINSATGNKEPTSPRQPVPVAAEPSPLPTKPILLPGIQKAGEVPLRANVPTTVVVGDSVPAASTRIERFGLPFAMHKPGANWTYVSLEESSYSIYRRMLAGEPGSELVNVWIAAHPCKDRAGCLADRAEFDRRWTARFRAKVPVTQKDAQTWFTEVKATAGTPYELSMTRAFFSPATKSWWLVGVDATARSAAEASGAQMIVNDIRTQTS